MRESRRLREELEPASLRQLGFSIVLVVAADRTGSGFELVLDELVRDLLSPTALECGGGIQGTRFEGFVTRWKGSTGEDDRRALARWLDARPEVVEYHLGPLVEAWQGA